MLSFQIHVHWSNSCFKNKIHNHEVTSLNPVTKYLPYIDFNKYQNIGFRSTSWCMLFYFSPVLFISTLWIFLVELPINVQTWFLLQFFSSEPLPCKPRELAQYPSSKELNAIIRDEEASRFMMWNNLSLYVYRCVCVHPRGSHP